MPHRWLIPALNATAVAVPLWLILALAAGTFTWRLAVVDLVIFAALWVVNMARAPRSYDSPPSPDEGWWNKW